MEGLLLSIFKYLNYEEADTLMLSFLVESQFLQEEDFEFTNIQLKI